MKILLIDIDSKIPNLALKKLEKYYLDRGDEVIWNNAMFRNTVDKIYVSCVFTKNKWKCNEWEGIAEIGGTGYDIKKTLPDEIENIKPKINIGFTTRGCIRKCEFCFVPEKEGKIKAVGDLYDIWDGKSKMVTFLDNNATALKKHFIKVLEQIRKEDIIFEYNQGLDIRLIDDAMATQIKKTRHDDLYFAWDDTRNEKQIMRGIGILAKAGIRRIRMYVLSGFNSTFEEDLYRLEKLKSLYYTKMQVIPYCMLHENCYKRNELGDISNKPKDEYVKLRNWVNAPGCFKQTTYENYSKEQLRLDKLEQQDIKKLQSKLF